MSTFFRRRPLLSFFLLAYGLTWVITVPWMLSRRGLITIEIPHSWEVLAAFGPLVAALIVARAVGGKPGMQAIFSSLWHWRVGWFWFLFTILTPLLLLLTAIVITATTSGAMPNFQSDGTRALLTMAGLFDLLIVSGFIQGLGEEPGWRGFALPQLRKRYGPLAATLYLFPVWLCWHLPTFLARPNFGLIEWMGFSLGILSAAIWLTLIWDATQSLLMAVLWHELINVCRNIALAVSMPMFLAIGNAVLLGAIIIMIYWLFKKPGPDRGEIPPLSN
ncbi:MAG: CPBP family intramembrane glutamic endopeptidase [Gammaproteobacteria bacterium]